MVNCDEFGLEDFSGKDIQEVMVLAIPQPLKSFGTLYWGAYVSSLSSWLVFCHPYLDLMCCLLFLVSDSALAAEKLR